MNLILNIIIGAFLMSSCQSDPCSSKDSFIVYHESFIADVEENSDSYSEKQWEERDSIFDSLMEDCYKKFEDELTKREDREIRKRSKIYVAQRFENGMDDSMAAFGKSIEKVFGENFEESMEKFGKNMEDVFDEDFTEIFENFGKDMEDIFDEDFQKSFEDLGANLEEVFDEDFKKSIEGFGENLKDVFDEDFKDDIKESMEDLKVELEKISEEVKEKNKKKI